MLSHDQSALKQFDANLPPRFDVKQKQIDRMLRGYLKPWMSVVEVGVIADQIQLNIEDAAVHRLERLVCCDQVQLQAASTRQSVIQSADKTEGIAS